MRQKILLICFLILIFGLAFIFQNKQKVITEVSTESSSPINSQTTLVTKVIDGDTIEIESGQKVRYIGIDTPETVDPRKALQCFGKEASEQNKKLVLGKVVKLVRDVSETDKYGRLLRYVYLGNNFINQTLVAEGFARATSYPPDIKFQDLFANAEKKARENNLGLWASCSAK